MTRIACFVEKYNFLRSAEAKALQKFKDTAVKLGYEFNFMFRSELSKVSEYDAVFIRATTDPLYTAYVVSKTAWELGLKVVDDPDSIRICANKIHQYKLFERFNVPSIPTLFLSREELCSGRIQEVFKLFGKPVVIKAPYTNFSKYVEKASCETSFRRIAKRFFRRSDFLVVQRFMPTRFDWRVGVLNGQVLYVCKYMMPKGKWKHGMKRRGKPSFIWGGAIPLKRRNAPQKLKEVALKACSVIGRGLYGVDVKEVNGEYLVVEVNDNPTIQSGYEDRWDKDIYKRIIRYLAE